MTAARRLAAILAADVVGYSRLMGEDEAGTARAVSEHREVAHPIVASFSGRIVKTTGDGVLMKFPSVVAAVECAIAIQKLMTERNAETPEGERILYRIGMNLGDVLVEGDDIIGDGDNFAARLEGVCEPGVFMFQAPPTTMFAGVPTPPSLISARRTSGTSLGRCGSTRSKGAEIEPRTQ
jgi:class 3 adenylate cyclase